MTLRTRTTLLVTAITGLTLAVGAVVLILTLQAQLRANGDALAQSRVRDLLAVAESGDLPKSLDNLNDEGIAQVVDQDGRVLASSPNIKGKPAIDDGSESSGSMTLLTIDAPDDAEIEHYRIWTETGPGVDGTVRVYVGSSKESVAEASRALTGALLVGLPVVIAMLALATWLVVGRSLRRVDRIRLEVDAITEDELHRRVPSFRVDDEVGRLAQTMNRMLGRLELAGKRQRAFVADASHELQSPLAAQRALIEVALTNPDPGHYPGEDLQRQLLATTAEMEQLVRDLLFLATEDDGRPAAHHVLVDLDDIVLEAATRARPTSGVVVDTSRVSGAPVLGDRGELQRLVLNLIDNAVRHASTTVRVIVTSDAEGALVEVLDDGPGIPESDREHVFERFYRGDVARSRTDSDGIETPQGGSGLGLAIARTIARRHGGDVTVGDAEVGAHLILRLPVGGAGSRRDQRGRSGQPG